MNALMKSSGPAMMSSREISKLVDSRHADVCRTVERLIASSVIQGYAPTAYTLEQNGQTYTEYLIGKRDSFVIVAQLSPEFTGRLVDRWQQLEAIVSAPLDLNDPAFLRSTLLTYTEKVLELQTQVAEQQPKIDALARIAAAAGNMCVSNAAKTLQLRPSDLFSWLSQHRWIFRRTGGAHWVAYQDKIQTGMLEHKVTTVERPDGTEKVTEQVLVTAKGMARIAEELVRGQE